MGYHGMANHLPNMVLNFFKIFFSDWRYAFDHRNARFISLLQGDINVALRLPLQQEIADGEIEFFVNVPGFVGGDFE